MADDSATNSCVQSTPRGYGDPFSRAPASASWIGAVSVPGLMNRCATPSSASVPTSSAAASASISALPLHADGHRAEPADPGFQHVARADRAHPGGGPGEYQVAGQQGHDPRRVRHDGGHRGDQVTGTHVLATIVTVADEVNVQGGGITCLIRR